MDKTLCSLDLIDRKLISEPAFACNGIDSYAAVPLEQNVCRKLPATSVRLADDELKTFWSCLS